MSTSNARTTLARLGPVRLGYTLGVEPQRGADLDQPLFSILRALHEAGSITHAAKALRLSYRHVWGLLHDWEAAFGEPLVVWSQGQPATLSAFGRQLLAAEQRSRKRMQPHIEALRNELDRLVADARGERPAAG